MPFWGSHKPKLLEHVEFAIIEDLTITDTVLGRGSYGIVYAAVYDGKPCVAKEMHPYLRELTSKHGPAEVCFKEINTLSVLRHPSIVQFLGVYFKDKLVSPILVMERMWMNLFSVLEQRSDQLPLLVKAHILYDVACGLQYLHGQKPPIVHRDLSANNVLVTESLEAKIADLGQAKALLNLAGQKLSTAPGNVAHMAPEALKHTPIYDSKMDIFSFGCTVLHTITELFPQPTDQFVMSEKFQNSYVKMTEIDRRKEFIDQMANKSSLLRQIAIQCLYDEPSSRPVASKLCEELQRYIKGMETESEVVAKQYKQNKLDMLSSLQKKESQLERNVKLIAALNNDLAINRESLAQKQKHITTLQEQLQSVKNKLEQMEVTQFNFEREKESLHKELIKQSDLNKELTMTCKNQGDRLREDAKAKQEEVKATNKKCEELQQEIQDLKTKLKDEILIVGSLKDELQTLQQENQEFQNRETAEKQKLANLEDELQKEKDKVEHFKQKENMLAAANEAHAKTKETLEAQFDEIKETLETKCEELKTSMEKCTEKEHMMVDLRKKLEDKESKLNKSVLQYNKLQEKYTVQYTCKNDQHPKPLNSSSAAEQISQQESQLLQMILELQDVNEKEHQQLQQQLLPYSNTLKMQEAQVLDLKKKSSLQKQQLEEKSYRLSTLESSCSELQESLYTREEKLKFLEDGSVIHNKLIENNDKLNKNLGKDLKSREESLKRKDEEIQLLKKEHADEISKLHVQYARTIEHLNKDMEMYKTQAGQRELNTLLQENTQYNSDLMKSTDEKFKKLENELKNSQKVMKRQIKHLEGAIKEKTKYIEKLENKSLDEQTFKHSFNTHWHPFVSLPLKRVRASAAATKDKVYVTGGYQVVNPDGEDLNSYLKFLERGNEVFCFHTGKCRCDSIASPVVLGGVVNVNGQCVLVSGAEGNTLTGNVYVLCEEGSDEQWKKFSEPVPTPRILPCVCCYGERWMIVCGGYACKEGSNLLKAVNVMEILDTTKGEWFTLSENNCPNVSSVLCCAVAGQDVYIIGDGIVFSSNSNKLITASTGKSESNVSLWSEVDINAVEELSGHHKPFSVVDINGQPMIIASISGSEDDVTCVLMKDTTDTWRKMSEVVECQHCSAVVVTPTLELLLFGGSEKVSSNMATNISQCGTLIPTLAFYGE